MHRKNGNALPELKFADELYWVLGYLIKPVRVIKDLGIKVNIWDETINLTWFVERTNLYLDKKTAYAVALHNLNAELDKQNTRVQELVTIGLKLANPEIE